MQLYKKAKKTLHNYFIYARPENRRREENTESQLSRHLGPIARTPLNSWVLAAELGEGGVRSNQSNPLATGL